MAQAKVSQLKGAALDWAVAKCEGREWEAVESFIAYHEDGEMRYSTNWVQGGPIIEREKIDVWTHAGEEWAASVDKGRNEYRGPTLLIAAMRCYVASKVGEKIEIPDELL